MDTVVLVAEVGDIHTHLALAGPDEPRPRLERLRTLRTPSGRLRPLLVDYMSQIPARSVDFCAVAASGRVKRLADRSFVTLPQAQLTIDPAELPGKPGTTRPPLLMNDLAAIAAALPLLSAEELLPVGPARTGAPGVRMVIGLSDKLGVAVLSSEGALLETDAGHLDLAAVSAEERLWLNRLAPLGRLPVNALLSAPGLARLYEATGGSPNTATQAVISRARSGEPLARKTVIAFSTWFGRFVGNLVLAYGGWSGVYLVGSVLDMLGDAFDAPAFRQGMEDKSPFSGDIGSVPVYRVCHPQPALLGLARLALSS